MIIGIEWDSIIMKKLTSNIQSNLSKEYLGRGDFELLQQKDGFRFGTDSVLLAWFASSFIHKGVNEVLDLGANCGACSMCVIARNSKARVDSVEIMPSAYEVLQKNIALNKLEDRLNAYNADIRDLPMEIKQKSYDVVMFNPPFFSSERGPKTSDAKTEEVLNARFEMNGGLEDFVKAASARVFPSKGHVVMVMHGNRLADSIKAFVNCGLSPTRLMTVHPFIDKEACMFLLAGKKDSHTSQLRILSPLVLNEKDKDGNIVATQDVIRIYEKEHTDCFI
ncbi:MAG TPA: methyltransferase [Saccharofermentans sp.]|nr:methyltransferase [Saccharofermentans sp.]